MSWQKNLGQGFNTVNELLNFLELPTHHGSLQAEKEFPSRIPQSFAKRMQKGNAQDPLLLQVLASTEEVMDLSGYIEDPLEESSVNPVKGLIQKYTGRVLMTLTGACAVNCRYCFRRHFPYENNNPGRQGWQAVYDYIASDTSITEVILSGGDPLLAPDMVWSDVIAHLDAIPHVHTLRIHSRVPVVFPERIDNDFLNVLSKSRLKKVIVLHANHPQELDDHVKQVCHALQQIGCLLLNQTVLLAGINADAQVLATLSQRLFSLGILPYYLHLLDKVKGAAHFDLPLEKAKAIYHEMQGLLPGYLVPRLVKEEPGQQSKTLVY